MIEDYHQHVRCKLNCKDIDIYWEKGVPETADTEKHRSKVIAKKIILKHTPSIPLYLTF